MVTQYPSTPKSSQASNMSEISLPVWLMNLPSAYAHCSEDIIVSRHALKRLATAFEKIFK